MVNVLCDTSFLIHLATHKIFNLDRIDVEIGQISFLVPTVVKNELTELLKISSKKQDIQHTLEYIKNFKSLELDGSFADNEILEYVKLNDVIVATMDKELKTLIKNYGRSVISFSNNKIILES